MTQLQLGDLTVDVILKDIKNVHLSVHPPEGRVTIAAPSRMHLDTIRVFAISKLEWIRRQQKKLSEQERETLREYVDWESHYVWGKRYLLNTIARNQAPAVLVRHSTLNLIAREGLSEAAKRSVIAKWYREQIKAVAVDLIDKWEPIIGVSVKRFFVQQMKTKWGSCNTHKGTIRLNTELAKKPKECLEYIVVHEMVHLLERHHNDRFRAYMDRFMPQWEQYRDELNRAPLAHVDWQY